MANEKKNTAEAKSKADAQAKINGQLIQRLEEVEAANDGLQKTITGLTAKIGVLEEAANASLQAKSVNDSVTVVTEEKKEKPAIPDAIKVGKKTVQFKVPALNLDGEKVLASDAVKDKVLMEELVEKYPGLFEIK